MIAREKKFFAPVLKSYIYDLSKRWRVEYYEPLHNGHSAKRVVLYGKINKGRTIEQRLTYANELISALNFDKPKPVSMLQSVMDTGRLQWRAKTISTYTTVVNKYEAFIHPKQAQTATEATINNFLLHMQGKGSNVGTLHKYRTILFRLYTNAIAQGLTTYNPVKKVPQIKKEPQSLSPFTDAQIGAIKNVCEGSQLWLAVQLLFYCFIRPGEQRFLKIGDINFEMAYIEIRGEISKNRKTQKVAIPDQFLQQIQFLKEYPNSFYVLSRSQRPGTLPVATNWINKTHSEVLNKLQIRGNYAFYSWKHTGAVRCVQAGLNIRDIQNQLRHHSLDMVAEYLKSLGVLQSLDLKNRYPTL